MSRTRYECAEGPLFNSTPHGAGDGRIRRLQHLQQVDLARHGETNSNNDDSLRRPLQRVSRILWSHSLSCQCTKRVLAKNGATYYLFLAA